MPASGAERPADFRGVFRTDEEARAVYAEAAGIGRALPLAVAVPADADDVSALVRWAHATRTPLVPRGAGSSMAGGAIGPGVVVDLSALDAIGAVDRTARTVRAGPGAVCAAVDGAARAHGLRFPVSPSSAAFCTLGGMAATNAAGAATLRYGAMRRWVRALDCVFDDGTRAEVRRGAPPPAAPAIDRFLARAPALRAEELAQPSSHEGVRKESSGYAIGEWAHADDLLDLLVGSEGTLALFVELELALAPIPGATATVLGVFDSLDAAVAAAVTARARGATACELLDRTFLEVAASGGAAGVPRDAEAVLLADAEGDDDAAATTLVREVAAAFRDAGARDTVIAADAGAAHDLWSLRHAVSPILSRLDPSVRSMQVIEDGAVPPERLAAYVRGVRAALSRQELRGVVFGHAGDAHVHVNPLVDVRLPDWRSRVEGLLDEVTALVASLGGTMAGEHGDGRLRAPLLDRCWSAAALDRFGRVKSAFDPLAILNPGTKLPVDGQRALGDIKYDPALPPLPAAARRALDRVERERAYARPRLALLDAARAQEGGVDAGIAAAQPAPAD